jgi:hypothetical protein
MSDDDIKFNYGADTFPFHPDCYTWPRLGVVWGDDTVVLHVHCLRDVERRQFSLVGFIDVDREDQISRVIFLAQNAGAEVIMFKGAGFTDNIVNSLMLNMKEPLPDEFPGQKIACMHVDWPNKIQRRVLRKLYDSVTPGEDFHEERLAKRLHMPVEEVRQHLEVLADIGLVEES